MKKTRLRAAALVAAGVLAGGVTAATITATAASNDPGSSSQADGHDGDGDGGHAGEKALTGANLTKATAVAKKAVPGGKVERAETDSGDAAYEVHMTKADGSEVTVKLDKAFALSGVESGHGK